MSTIKTDIQKQIYFQNSLLQNRLKSIGSKIILSPDVSIFALLAKHISNTAIEIDYLNNEIYSFEEKKDYSAQEKDALFLSCYQKILVKTLQNIVEFNSEHILAQVANNLLSFSPSSLETIDDGLLLCMLECEMHKKIIWDAFITSYTVVCKQFFVKPDAIIHLNVETQQYV